MRLILPCIRYTHCLSFIFLIVHFITWSDNIHFHDKFLMLKQQYVSCYFKKGSMNIYLRQVGILHKLLIEKFKTMNFCNKCKRKKIIHLRESWRFHFSGGSRVYNIVFLYKEIIWHIKVNVLYLFMYEY